MSGYDSFELPEITDDDIRHASQLLDLPSDAFYGPDGDDPRQDAIKCMDSIDVAACPGSGKTTLLVAKLAILARKWSSPTRGICVLSHTNAARHEIENHLGGTSEGQKLLGYPHYIGTIHGFVNEFLALPYLRSSGYSSILFNSEISKQKILSYSKGGKQLPRYFYNKIKEEKLRLDAVCNAIYIGSELDIKISSGNIDFQLKRKGAKKDGSFNILDQWKKDILESGYAAYGDIFAYGQKMLTEYPGIISIIRGRYPMLFIDESQDNSNEQIDILNRIFMNEGSSVVRQRFGDGNQAIYDFWGEKEAIIDAFPALNPIELPNSHRFGQSIASLADPLGLNPCGLKGAGPKYSLNSGLCDRNTIFLFDEDNIGNVLGAYGDLILDIFSEQEANSDWFRAHAVGNIHKPAKEVKEAKFPRDVKHYIDTYDHELNKADPKPNSFLQYLSAGKSLSEQQGETYPMIEKIAEALLRLSSYSIEQKVIERRRYKHRYVLDLLKQDSDCWFREKYLGLINKLAVDNYIPGKEEWEKKWCKPIKVLAKKIVGAEELKAEADEFLKWDDGLFSSTEKDQITKPRNNIFLHSKNGREISIKVGSIHSVKGQTHTATLVFETFWNAHNLKKLLPWLSGDSSGWKRGSGTQQKSRLKSHYVAMSRPTHLLCLAMKRKHINDDMLVALKGNGWKVCEMLKDGQQISL
ncbi:MAG: UvrD-helicase domain-containing protein [Gammaproteobacteria bacterium]|nr:UvrD-helicase domain-containing protein [Gammaproteobacteria bacterium]MCF6261838.1 UvrD-helicase domain-containing protein [Gammaproteobacteria bacterium]